MKEQIELLENYIDGDISLDESASVGQLISSDPEFKKEYDLRREVNKAIGEKNIMQFRYKLNMIHEQQIKSSSGKVRNLFERKWHLAAASITILILVGSLLISNIGNSGPEQLFNQYYTTENAVFTTRSSNDDNNIELKEGLQQFQLNNYSEAITWLKKSPDNIVSEYYLGISYIETKQYSQAKEAFHKIIEQESNLFTEQAQWYKGLCLLKLNEISEATLLFTSIKNSSSLYNDDAGEILKKLN